MTKPNDMTISINRHEIAKAINDAATKALASSQGRYETQRARAAIISKDVAKVAIGEAIRLATSQIDTRAIAQALAAELERACVRSAVALLQDELMSTICTLRGIGDYTTEDKAARARLRAELFAK